MKKENVHLGIRVEKVGLTGLLNVLYTAPIGDPVPRMGRLEFGGSVRVSFGRDDVLFPVDGFPTGCELGDRVLVGWVGQESSLDELSS